MLWKQEIHRSATWTIKKAFYTQEKSQGSACSPHQRWSGHKALWGKVGLAAQGGLKHRTHITHNLSPFFNLLYSKCFTFSQNSILTLKQYVLTVEIGIGRKLKLRCRFVEAWLLGRMELEDYLSYLKHPQRELDYVIIDFILTLNHTPG